jgi:hypothetical protein
MNPGMHPCWKEPTKSAQITQGTYSKLLNNVECGIKCAPSHSVFFVLCVLCIIEHEIVYYIFIRFTLLFYFYPRGGGAKAPSSNVKLCHAHALAYFLCRFPINVRSFCSTPAGHRHIPSFPAMGSCMSSGTRTTRSIRQHIPEDLFPVLLSAQHAASFPRETISL